MAAEAHERGAFSFLFDTGAATLPDDIAGAAPGDSAARGGPLADGAYFFHLRTKDVARNWTPGVHVGPLGIDATAPEATLDAPQGGEEWGCGEDATILWEADDATSGVGALAESQGFDSEGSSARERGS